MCEEAEVWGQTDGQYVLFNLQVVKTIPIFPADALLCGSNDINKGVGVRVNKKRTEPIQGLNQ